MVVLAQLAPSLDHGMAHGAEQGRVPGFPGQGVVTLLLSGILQESLDRGFIFDFHCLCVFLLSVGP